MKTFIEKLLLPTLGQGSSRRSWSEEPRKVHCLFTVCKMQFCTCLCILSVLFGTGKREEKSYGTHAFTT